MFMNHYYISTGVLKASLQGPTRYHHCDIDDKRDGTYEILFRPVEVGHYQLGVLYDEIHIPGQYIAHQRFSYFELNGCFKKIRNILKIILQEVFSTLEWDVALMRVK